MAVDIDLNQSTDALTRQLRTNPAAGLSKLEVKERLELYGYNEVAVKKEHPLRKFFKKFWGITAWMLEMVIVLSWFLHRFIDLYIVTSLLIGNAIISFAQEWFSSKALESLRKELYIHVKVLRQGKWLIIAAKELVPGDIISIKTGDFAPADVKIMSGTLEIDQSALTGESLTVEKNLNDLVYSGSMIRRGEAICLVVLTGIKTFFGKTVELVQLAAPQSHIESVVSGLTKWQLAIVAIAVFIFFLMSFKRGIALLEIFPLTLVLLLAAIPVALPAMFTISMALGSRELSKKKVLVTRLNAIEDAATMDILCIDKTGTITMGQIAIVQVIALNGYSQTDVILYGALASKEAGLDPIDLAFISAAKENNLPVTSFTVKEFVPFEPKSKRTEALIEKNGHIVRIYKGALGLLVKNLKLPDEVNTELKAYSDTFAKKGFRTIAVAKNVNTIPEILGLVALEDRPRPESKQVLRELTDLGISIKLLTGDALPIAKEIASIVGLNGHSIDFATYKDSISKNPTLAKETVVENTIFAEIFPEDKYNIVKILQSNDHVVGMTGDGVNDAPALQQAEVGIAVSDATDIAKNAASVVLLQPGLYKINELIKLGRLVFQRVNTWIVNKISRTILKTGFIVIAFLITDIYVISSSEMLLLIFMTDFIKLSLSTDIEKISKTPCFWNISSLTKEAFILGVAMILEALGLLYVGIKYFHLNKLDLHTFSFQILFYFAIFSIFVVREKGHFWESMPSRIFLISIIIDIIIAFLITTFGLLGFNPIPIPYTLFVVGYAFLFSLIINDWLKFFFQPKEQKLDF